MLAELEKSWYFTHVRSSRYGLQYMAITGGLILFWSQTVNVHVTFEMPCWRLTIINTARQRFFNNYFDMMAFIIKVVDPTDQQYTFQPVHPNGTLM